MMTKSNSRSYIYGFDKVVKPSSLNLTKKKSGSSLKKKLKHKLSRVTPDTEIIIDSQTINSIHGDDVETPSTTPLTTPLSNSVNEKSFRQAIQDEQAINNGGNQRSVTWAWASASPVAENASTSSKTDHLASIIGNMTIGIQDSIVEDTSDDSDEWDTDLEEEYTEPKTEYDNTGSDIYINFCEKYGVIPVAYLLRHFDASEIIMQHHGLGPKGAIPLAHALLNNTRIEKLDLSDNYIKEEGGQALAEMLQENMYIREFNISGNFIGSAGATYFARMLCLNTSLRTLILNANHITDRNAKVLSEALKINNTLSFCGLSNNEFGELGAVSLASGLADNGNLDVLDLSWNSIRGRGGVALAKALRVNTTLVSLNLAWNGISDVGAFALAKFLRKNTTLQRLDVSNNRIGETGATKLGKCIAVNNAITHFKISMNPIGNKGVESLLNGAKHSDSLKFLGLEEITVSQKIHDEIEELMELRAIKIFHGGKGGYYKPEKQAAPMDVLDRFIKLNRWRLIDVFFRLDKDKSGDLTKDELKNGLKEAGLEMSANQLDLLMEFLDKNKNNKIEYSELIEGQLLLQKERRLSFRAERSRASSVNQQLRLAEQANKRI